MKTLLLLFFSLLATVGVSQESVVLDSAEENPADLLSFSSHIVPETARPGEIIQLNIDARLEPGWRIYSLKAPKSSVSRPTKIRVSPSDFRVQGEVKESLPKSKFDDTTQKIIPYHNDQASFSQKFLIPEEQPLGTFKISGKVFYLLCNDEKCFAPQKWTFANSFTIQKGPVRGLQLKDADQISRETFDDSQEDPIWKDGFGAFVILAIISGIFALLTPCTFPMIPITISFFVQKSHHSRVEVLRLASIFALGIVFTYTSTGFLMSLLLGATGAIQLASNGWVNFLIGIMFVGFGLSLMEVFTIPVPAHLDARMDQAARKRGGYAGVILMGLAFTLTSFTCTVQFVGSLLIASTQGHWLWPLMGMFIFSATFAAPFFLLALFPRWIQSFQKKSGKWMVQLKWSLGVVEMGAAVKFFSNADLVWQWGFLNRSVVLAIWTVLSLWILGYLLRVHPREKIWTTMHQHLTFYLIILFAGSSIYWGRGWAGTPLDSYTESFLPPPLVLQGSDTSKQDPIANSELYTRLKWYPSFGEASKISQQQNKPLFIDMTGYTCVNCRWMEKEIFSDVRILDEFEEHFVLAQLYVDGGEYEEENQQLLVNRFHTLALPTYVMMSPQGKIIDKRSGITKTVEEFLKFLEKGEE